MNLLREWRETKGPSARIYRAIDLSYPRRKRVGATPWSKHPLLPFRSQISPPGRLFLWPGALTPQGRGGSAGYPWRAAYFSAPEHPSQRMWLTKQPWSWLHAAEPDSSQPSGDCSDVVEILQQTYTNTSGWGVGFTDVRWTYSLIHRVSSHNGSCVSYLPGGIVSVRVDENCVAGPVRQLGWMTIHLSSKTLRNAQSSEGTLAPSSQYLLEGLVLEENLETNYRHTLEVLWVQFQTTAMKWVSQQSQSFSFAEAEMGILV